MSAPLHLLHLRLDRGEAHWSLTCEDPEHTTCKTITDDYDEDGEPILHDYCFTLDWFDELGLDMVVGNLTEPTFPVAVTPDWDGDSACLLLPGAVRP